MIAIPRQAIHPRMVPRGSPNGKTYPPWQARDLIQSYSRDDSADNWSNVAHHDLKYRLAVAITFHHQVLTCQRSFPKLRRETNVDRRSKHVQESDK